MIKLVRTVAIIALVGALVQTLPDIARYLRMRNM